MRRRFAPLLALALVAASPAPPALAPLHATTIGGAAFDAAPARREVVVVHYWATWCAPCKVEMPMLDAAWRRYHAQGLQMIGVALDAGASRQKIAKHDMDVSFPIARAADTDLPRGALPSALPETLVYGRDGRLRHVFRAGGSTFDAALLDRLLPPLLAER
ncbi:MAG: TlpA family protein disulfide reductase [Sphingomonadales bacterium]|nr:TlpA family protein disulfide reductase [Sphingomonadales bacterium]MDE2567693.1 TlpA family protein disulfide reductase [Sphingomonadales bacterium]